jgi:hypothetical protein
MGILCGIPLKYIGIFKGFGKLFIVFDILNLENLLELRMRSFIKEKAREIISDPKKNKELREAISRLRETADDGESSTKAIIGGRTYKIRFINQNSK